ncbi:pre-60S ribosomal particles component [Coemansia spiralis]|uniref:Pre-60S ribosomal particles component n=2 Tax=Coemansia TaxID=4863 RepID=A0A9W8KZP9_9FUNG|nr:Rrp15p-domain-containing protein [Coemansia spiralis]KAJ1989887.1 pre-60S ribosomal particles component [Coemansia umbellata]KAJ2623117.1 pre-60S ribosomal particles component [Coemansia sp. RSA 1358]KAJ2681054.1 pre-60S ribosomal particles component [Coemansia spiralis]
MDVTKKQRKNTTRKGTQTAKVARPASSDSDDAMHTDNSDYETLARQSKKKPKKKHADNEEFANVLTSILAQDTRDKTAIMAKDKTRENQIKEEILNYRARKAVVEERRALLSKDRVVPSFESLNYERTLRKVATRGVIKLFNVVKAQQAELSKISSTQTTRTEKVAEMSKSKFLDLLKTKTS